MTKLPGSTLDGHPMIFLILLSLLFQHILCMEAAPFKVIERKIQRPRNNRIGPYYDHTLAMPFPDRLLHPHTIPEQTTSSSDMSSRIHFSFPQDAFTHACEVGDLMTVTQLLWAQQVDLSDHRCRGLKLAIANGHVAVVKELLLDSAFDLKQNGNHFFVYACHFDNASMIQLLSRFVSVDVVPTVDREDLSVLDSRQKVLEVGLYQAARHENPKAVECLLSWNFLMDGLMIVDLVKIFEKALSSFKPSHNKSTELIHALLQVTLYEYPIEYSQKRAMAKALKCVHVLEALTQ